MFPVWRRPHSPSPHLPRRQQQKSRDGSDRKGDIPSVQLDELLSGDASSFDVLFVPSRQHLCHGGVHESIFSRPLGEVEGQGFGKRLAANLRNVLISWRRHFGQVVMVSLTDAGGARQRQSPRPRPWSSGEILYMTSQLSTCLSTGTATPGKNWIIKQQ